MVRSLVLVAQVACSSALACSPAASHPDAPSSAWSLGPAMPRRALDAGVAPFGLRVVVAGGFDGVEITPRVDMFSVVDDGWSALPDAPVRWTSANVAAVGTRLFLLGGLGAGRVASGEGFVLDPGSSGWQPTTPMRDARGGSGVVTAPGRVYLLGGVSSTGALASCLAYDTIGGSWTPLPDLPAPRAHPAAMRRSDGTLIVAGGFESADASQPRDEVWALFPGGQGGWQLRSAPQRVARGGCAYGVVLGQLICAGGEGGAAASTLVESYDSYADVWIEGEAMPVARAGAQGAALGARLFVPGGADAPGTDATDTLYIYAPLATAPR